MAGQGPFDHRTPPVRVRPPVIAAIAAGGALGGMARYGASELMPHRSGTFPWSTFAVNVAGAFVLAVLLVFVLEVWPPTRYVRPFFAVGFLGAFTTFSTWMYETDRLLSSGHVFMALTYLVASLAAGLAAVAFGLIGARAVTSRHSTEG